MRQKTSKEEFARLVREHAAEVISFAQRLLADRAEAEEVAQDAFVRAYRQLSSFSGDSSLLTWVQRIAYHEAIDRLRRRRPRMADISELPLAVADEDLSTDREERIQLLEEAVDHLPTDDQLLLHLYYYEERPLRDIAYIMDAEPNTLSARLYRIRKRLLHMIKLKENE
ncbi:MAG: sigma-70 family RNA polymerase sigma factor [Prevotella sp.]|nr:sigma-70 family RNA polymerase sigma factor [Prevotella sp.]